MRGTQRLFLALWPDPATAAALAVLARDVAEHAHGKATPPENIHLTLAFLGNQPSAIVPDLIKSMRAIVPIERPADGAVAPEAAARRRVVPASSQ